MTEEASPRGNDGANGGDASHDYAHVHVPSLPDAPNPTRHKKEVDEAVGAATFGFNVYTAEPGEQLPWGFHHHPDHEELLYVLEGAVEVETADGSVRVATDEAFFVPAGAPQKAVAVGDGPARVVAAGAPKDADGAVIAERCPSCGERTGREYAVEDEDGVTIYVLSCAACGAETDRLRPGPEGDR